MRSINDKLNSKAPRVRNSSPFYQNQQAKRFGIDGASRITSSREKAAERKALGDVPTTSKMMED